MATVIRTSALDLLPGTWVTLGRRLSKFLFGVGSRPWVTHILRLIPLLLGVDSRPRVTHTLRLIKLLFGLNGLPRVSHGPVPGVILVHDLFFSLPPTLWSKGLDPGSICLPPPES